ncbi:MAG TPA: hypothetical protein ENN09_07180, partial [Planctomycetes bacterium]|nr:hypothetical protein [Planctomycetota bacterium]
MMKQVLNKGAILKIEHRTPGDDLSLTLSFSPCVPCFPPLFRAVWRLAAAMVVTAAMGCGDVRTPYFVEEPFRKAPTAEMKSIATQVKQELEKMLSSDWADIRRGAIELLSTSPAADFLPVCIQTALTDIDAEARAAAALALRKSVEPGVRDILLKITEDGNPTVKYSALEALYYRQDARETVISMLQNDVTGNEAEMRVRALIFLARHPELDATGWETVPETGSISERLLV